MERPLLEDIRDRLDEFTATEKKAAHALLANYPMQGLGTVAQFAEAAGVSSPTILRFVGRLGFPGFAEFQRKLRGELESQVLLIQGLGVFITAFTLDYLFQGIRQLGWIALRQIATGRRRYRILGF